MTFGLSRQRGFTLIEALVALLVLSIGLLGVAAMQLEALQGAHAAYQRSIASLAAQDAQERVWAKAATDTAGALACPSSDIASVQAQWHGEWLVYLPGFSDASIITQPDSLVCEFQISVIWTERRFGDTTEKFSYTVRLPEE
ncbi:type IV pilus modification protein PilV [Halomonas sp. TRM85114]|uniref:type IV pilus modification protein PilV n=1 Tax=Halomonas jincaotanensis TaxID=2810616 RepID=UPI001BD52790|nr:type IV pilus modification protein PilV [Halomonas jincaotanensis]MBS9404898.1 type IV pilus modification protein PilV [Halomonas jincaotanensis]